MDPILEMTITLNIQLTATFTKANDLLIYVQLRSFGIDYSVISGLLHFQKDSLHYYAWIFDYGVAKCLYNHIILFANTSSLTSKLNLFAGGVSLSS